MTTVGAAGNPAALFGDPIFPGVLPTPPAGDEEGPFRSAPMYPAARWPAVSDSEIAAAAAVATICSTWQSLFRYSGL